MKGLLIAIALLAQTPTEKEHKFTKLQQKLEQYNFPVKIEATPVRSTYGLFEKQTQTIWIHPVVFDLGIALPTLIHEATHAAQYCAGDGEVVPLNLSISPPNIARPYFTHYQQGMRRHLEAEAYAVQTHSEGYQLVTELLEKHCE